jgi:hypothetical protein
VTLRDERLARSFPAVDHSLLFVLSQSATAAKICHLATYMAFVAHLRATSIVDGRFAFALLTRIGAFRISYFSHQQLRLLHLEYL